MWIWMIWIMLNIDEYLWLGIRRSNFMRSKQEIETISYHEINKNFHFYEIESVNNHLISWLLHFSWDWKLLIMHFRLSILLLKLGQQKCSWDQKSKKHYYWVSISWSKLHLKICSWDWKYLNLFKLHQWLIFCNFNIFGLKVLTSW